MAIVHLEPKMLSEQPVKSHKETWPTSGFANNKTFPENTVCVHDIFATAFEKKGLVDNAVKVACSIFLAAGQTNTFSLQNTVEVADADDAPMKAVADTAATAARPNIFMGLIVGSPFSAVIRRA